MADFRIDLTVSDSSYLCKPPIGSSEYRTMSFTQRSVSVEGLSELISEGRAFSAVYRKEHFIIKQKSVANFVRTNVIPIDIDDSEEDMQCYMDSFEFPPTIAYETFSDGLEGKGRRFRFLYIFDEPVTSSDGYTSLYKAVCNANNISTGNDHCMKSCNQMFFGTCCGRAVKSNEDFVYSINEFDPYKVSDVTYKVPQKPSNGSNRAYNIIFSDDEFRKYWKGANDTDLLSTFDCYCLPEMTNVDFDGDELFKDLRGTEYFEVKRRWKISTDITGKKYPQVCRVKNGEGRRKHIYMVLMNLRQITPDASAEQLCYMALRELYHFVDNSDSKDFITRGQLSYLVAKAIETDLERYKDRLNRKRSFKVNRAVCAVKDLSVRKAVGIANGEMHHKRKLERYEMYDKFYDPNKTDKENLKVLEDNGLKISLESFRRYRKEHLGGGH